MLVENWALCKSRAISSFPKVTSEIKLHEGIHTSIILLKHSVSSFILVFQIKAITVGTPYSSLNIASSCITGGLDWILGKISLLNEWSDIGTGCPGKWLSHHPWRGSKNVWHGGVGLTVRLDLRGLFQPIIL